ncbi:MAG: efflux RND transporter periplasmic adaptor subunit [Rhodanobacteraceae bacterium]|nr:MAG: efflux RND transporter periplasmic adaptor subunit [Rhodanobacteraceae bacterium]
MNRIRLLLRVAPALTAALLLTACGRSQHQYPTQGATAIRAAVAVVTPVTETRYAQSPGTVVAAQTARIASRLTGYVRSLAVDVGDHVQAGQLLLTIDNRDVEAQVTQAHAVLASARAAYSDAAFNYERYSNLYRQQAVTRQEYESIKRTYAAARSGVSAAEAGLAQADAQRAYAEVRAPFAGVITARLIEAGDLATPGRPLLVIDAPAHLEVHSQITPRAYAALGTGKTVYVVNGATRLAATVVQLSPAADPATETHLIKAVLPAGSGLAPGAYVNVQVPVGTYRALFVPDTAVVTRAGLTEVFVLDRRNRAQLHMVRIGEHRGANTGILSGLTAGDRIVVHPGDVVGNGSLIEPALP